MTVVVLKFLILTGCLLIHTGELYEDIMNYLILFFSSSLSDDPICNAEDCESEDSFVTALDESSTVTEKSTSCDCQKYPESSDICCCQHFLKIKLDCHGKDYDFVILSCTLYSVGRSREEVCH